MKTTKLFSLIFVKKNEHILLGYKTRGLGQGLWNGFGGKIEPEESILSCAHRELTEECCLRAKSLKHLGIVKYDVINDNKISIVHVFTCANYTGVEKCSDEMNPVKWFSAENIPYEKMWPDASKWWPFMLNEKHFSVHCVYKDGQIYSNLVREHSNIKEAEAALDIV